MRSLKILVVDDEVYIVHILEFSLLMEGYEVITADNGQKALQQVERGQPDLVILDARLPGIDSFDICRQLRQQEATRNLPIILLSAKGRPIDRQAGLDAGASDYVMKPFSPKRLLETIARLLQEREQSTA